MVRSISALLIFASCAAHGGQQRAQDDGERASVSKTWQAKVSNVGDRWSLDYDFVTKQSALLFDFGHGREQFWRSNEDDVHIENAGGLDLMVMKTPRETASFQITPTKPNGDGPAPFLPFSDGSSAIHLGQFPVLTVESAESARALQGNLGAWRGNQPAVEVVLESDSPIRAPDGHLVPSPARFDVQGGGGYAYLGSITPTQKETVSAIVDPGLPPWLASRVGRDILAIYEILAARWGRKQPKVSVLLAYGGDGSLEAAPSSSDSFQNKGYATDSQLSMWIRGPAYRSENPQALERLLWFFAHEASHQFQFQDGIRREAGAAWMHEGAADAMAVAVLVDLGLMSRGQLERRYWRVHRECAALLGDGPLQGSRGRAGYVCGDLIAHMTAAALPNTSLFGFWNALRQAAQRDDDGVITSARYLALVRALGADAEVVSKLEALVSTRLADPEGALSEAMQTAGLAPVFADDGGLSRMSFAALERTEPRDTP